MAKETSARVAKIAGRALEDPYSISGADIKALAASALAQREVELAWPKWKDFTENQQARMLMRWKMDARGYSDLRRGAIAAAKRALKKAVQK